MIPPDHDRADPAGPRHAARRSLLRRWWWPTAVLATAAAVTAFALHADDHHACVAQAAVTLTAPTARSGMAVYYDYRQGRGNCSFDQLPSEGLYASLSPPEYDGATACGATLDIQGPRGTVRVTVVDQCPGCAVGRLDLSRDAFTRIASISSGAVPITYRPVFDPLPAEPLRVSVATGSSASSLALNVADTGNPLESVAVLAAGGDWRAMTRRSDDFWVADPGGTGPFEVRISDTIGHSVTVRDVALRPGVQDTDTVLYREAAVSSPTISPTTPSAPSPISGSQFDRRC